MLCERAPKSVSGEKAIFQQTEPPMSNPEISTSTFLGIKKQVRDFSKLFEADLCFEEAQAYLKVSEGSNKARSGSKF